MKIIGIIAEYNPFHLGHLHHLKEAKEKVKPDGTISVMSGHFTQRGEISIFDKWSRTKMALSQGIDLVLELPVLYSCRSAYWFAKGGIETLNKTGIVTHLAFGVETDNIQLLSKIANMQAQKPPSYRKDLKFYLDQGISFPEAKAKALTKNIPNCSIALGSPNNILGLSYLQVLNELNINISPIAVDRKGSDYNEPSLLKDVLPSATAIRNQLLSKNKDRKESLSLIKEVLPQEVYEIICTEIINGRGPVDMNCFSSTIMTLLRKSTLQELKNIVDITEGLEYRIKKVSLETSNIADFLKNLKTKRYTYTRLQRFLIHLLLSYTKEKEDFLSYGPPYLRVLGFNDKGKDILKEIKKTATIPVLTKGGHSKKFLHDSIEFKTFWDMDVRATDIFSLAIPKESLRYGGLDYYTNPVQLATPR